MQSGAFDDHCVREEAGGEVGEGALPDWPFVAAVHLLVEVRDGFSGQPAVQATSVLQEKVSLPDADVEQF